MLYSTAATSTVQHSKVHYSKVQSKTVQYSIAPYSTVLYTALNSEVFSRPFLYVLGGYSVAKNVGG